MRSNPTTHSTVVPQGLQHAEEHNAAYDSRTTDVGEIRLDSSTNTTHEAGHEPYRLQASIEMQQTITMPYRATIIVYATGPPSIPKASFTHVHLLVKSESGFDVELVDGPVFVQSFQPQDRIVLTVCASIKRNPITPGVFEELYSDIKALLSCSEQTVFTLKVTYHHPQFPQDTSLILRKNCTVTEPVPPHQVIPKSPSSSAVLRVPRDTDSASYHDDTPSVARLSGELRSTRNPGRGSRRPGHGTIVAPKSSGIEQGHTPGHAADAAREVWRHMRLDNRTPSINPDMRAVKQDPPPLRRHDTGVVIAAMKNTALTNKRSIDEETLREWEENLSMTLRTNDMSMRNMADLDMPCGLANVPWL
ncbi:Hypothetical protein D9617_19g103450 [Elsinoe fawcettii]|nr:Hypothetical protein D9617_19g103450 [Elsinoe fawcettii]